MRRSERIADANLAKQQALIQEGVPEITIKKLSRDNDRLRRKVQTAVKRNMDLEKELEKEQLKLWNETYVTNQDAEYLEEQLEKIQGRIQKINKADILGNDLSGLQMPPQPTADSAISEGVPLHLRDNKAIVTPGLPFYLRTRDDFVNEVPYHPALISNEPQPSRKRKREEFESSTEGQAPFNTIGWNFVAVEESKRASKRVRRHAPLCLYEQLLAQREHLAQELQLVTERLTETRRKGKSEIAFKKLIKQEAEDLYDNVRAQVVSALQQEASCEDALFALAPCKFQQQQASSIELDDDACSPESSDSESGAKELVYARNSRFEYCFDQTHSCATEEMQLVLSEYSEENVVEMEI